jgi:pyruvate dehydrogenase E1 component alpha subunit
VLAVRDVTRRLREKAEKDKEPAIMDVVSFRFRGHSVIDPDRYRNQDEVKKGRAKHDPIALFAGQLLDGKVINDKWLKEIAEQVEHEVQEAIDFAEHSAPPKIEDMYKFMYATDVPNTLSEAEQAQFDAKVAAVNGSKR